MNLSKLPLFSLISQRMSWLAERQKVLAENVANADTPNYKARDLAPPNFTAMVEGMKSRLRPAATDPRHLSLREDGPKAKSVVNKGAETTASGNSVSLDAEMTKVAETAMDYQLITNLYRKQIGLIRTVVGRNQS